MLVAVLAPQIFNFLIKVSLVNYHCPSSSVIEAASFTILVQATALLVLFRLLLLLVNDFRGVWLLPSQQLSLPEVRSNRALSHFFKVEVVFNLEFL